jgi:4-alpha-glucanotransferase
MAKAEFPPIDGLPMQEWTERAVRWGVEPTYHDVRGRRHDAGEDALRRIVTALGEAGDSPSPVAVAAGQPHEAYQGDGRRGWLLAVQLYAVRSRRNWGHGDFTDLGLLMQLVADLGGAGIGLNPLHALFHDRADGSPYSPSSRLFLNPLYIDVEAIEEFDIANAAGLAADVQRLRAAPLVDYPAVARLKSVALQAAHRAFIAKATHARRRDLEDYRRERGAMLGRFAAFETLRAHHPSPWRQWPEQWRRASEETVRQLRDRHPEEMAFHEFVQWIAERQLQKCRDIARRQGLSIGLYLDTAVGVDAGGADAWIDQGAFLNGLSIGAPPDQFNPAGQDWGITAYNPHRLVAGNFEPFRQMLRAAMRHAGAIRIDHVLGLMRLFVVPRELPADQGVYLRMPFEALLAVLVEESHRWRCVIIGEDLGTVPDGFRATLSAWGVWSYLVMMFERRWDGSFRPSADYPERAIATLNTHDLPTFEGWMSGHDLATKRAIDVDPGETDDERSNARNALIDAVGATDGRREIGFEDVVAFLAATPTRLVCLAVEDILGLKDQVNVPGTVHQHPNWRRRWPIPLEDLAGDQRLHRVAEILAEAGRGKAPSA